MVGASTPPGRAKKLKRLALRPAFAPVRESCTSLTGHTLRPSGIAPKGPPQATRLQVCGMVMTCGLYLFGSDVMTIMAE